MGMSEMLVAHADTLAWDNGLRGDDAVHRAAANLWQDSSGGPEGEGAIGL